MIVCHIQDFNMKHLEVQQVEVQQVKVGKGDKWTGVNQGEGRGDEDDV
jgi:hypothetical protein